MADFVAATGTRSVASAVRILMYVQIAFMALALVAFLFLILRKYVLDKKSQEIVVVGAPAPEDKLRGIRLDLSSVRRDFAVGERFEHEGLVVNADYDSGSRRVTDFSVDAPGMDVAGTASVTVRYGGFSESYDIEVGETVEPRFPIGMTLELSRVRRQFAVGENFDSSGLEVNMEYNLEPFAAPAEDFAVEAPDMATPGEKIVYVSCGGFVEMYSVSVVGDAEDATSDASGAESFYYDDIPAANDEGYYDDISAAYDGDPYDAGGYAPEADAAQDFAEEESAAEVAAPSAGDTVLRYDRSFVARLAQATEGTKGYYSAIKNELLAYDGVKEKMSWKRETFRTDGGCVAKLGFRGGTLCLLLPIDPALYAGTRYKVEDVSSDRSGEDTPCLFRIKNDKRLRLSYDLIARVTQERGLVRRERDEIDYREPYRDDAQLLKAGLIRREVKTLQEEESVFARGKAGGGEE